MAESKVRKREQSRVLPLFMRRYAALVLILCLTAATAILAQRNNPTRLIAQNQNPAQGTAAVSPSSLSPSLGSKDYVYAGGKVIATEERIKFADVTDGSDFYEDIYRIAARGVTVGCSISPPNYCPDFGVTRDQMAVFIEKALGVFSPPTPTGQSFTDVPPNHWAYRFIEDFATRGITAGCTSTTYCPDTQVTHDQMAVFVIKARGEFNPPTPPNQRFDDVPPSHWAYKFIDRMADLDIWLGQGCGPNNYCPSAPVTRRQMARILVRALGI